jgi:hypothetical protein
MFFHRHPERKCTVGEETQKLFFFLPGVFCLAIPVTTATSSLEKITDTHMGKEVEVSTYRLEGIAIGEEQKKQKSSFFAVCLSLSPK